MSEQTPNFYPWPIERHFRYHCSYCNNSATHLEPGHFNMRDPLLMRRPPNDWQVLNDCLVCPKHEIVVKPKGKDKADEP